MMVRVLELRRAKWRRSTKGAMKRADDNSAAAIISQSIVPAGAWTIWRTRNEAIFNGARVY
ncbi:hypothetical protein QJS10_CPA08g00704 [Acorus calamus]|uniref:Uncharacterized protein n=1 Tax=Acorus calamus TaxID=4465 RepID=A0AAV9EAC0_ACOCL|nr:hypothetical protein QJS10_CPA08g00704 [Acorus calamus]